MTTIVINNLTEVQTLDKQAMTAVVGGLGYTSLLLDDDFCGTGRKPPLPPHKWDMVLLNPQPLPPKAIVTL